MAAFSLKKHFSFGLIYKIILLNLLILVFLLIPEKKKDTV